MITQDQVLVHYEPEKPMTLATDASPHGLGAVLSHTMLDGSDKPIAFASTTLGSTVKKYLQTEKEAPGIVRRVKQFHTYLYGRKFTLLTDHQRLISIFHAEIGVPVRTAAKLQKYALYLSGFKYDIRIKALKHCHADALSRLPVVDPEHGHSDKEYDSTELYMIRRMDS